MLDQFNLADSWSAMKDKLGYTYVDKSRDMKSRLNYFLVSRNCKLDQNDIKVLVSSCVPDHNVLILCMSKV